MVRAMKETDFEPLFIEELVRFGEDRGRSEGLEQGARWARRIPSCASST